MVQVNSDRDGSVFGRSQTERHQHSSPNTQRAGMDLQNNWTMLTLGGLNDRGNSLEVVHVERADGISRLLRCSQKLANGNHHTFATLPFRKISTILAIVPVSPTLPGKTT